VCVISDLSFEMPWTVIRAAGTRAFPRSLSEGRGYPGISNQVSLVSDFRNGLSLIGWSSFWQGFL
jgi:hypothetical protein